MEEAESALLARVALAPSVLVASDYDGTLADIARIPASARARPGALEALGTIARSGRASVAVISGRTLESLREHTSELDGAWRAAEHGAFLEPPGAAPRLLGGSIPEAVMDELVALAERSSRALRGAWVERKRTGVSIHFRDVTLEDRPRMGAALAPFREGVERRGLTVLDGRQVVEARSPSHSKATALAEILAHLPPRTLPVFAGDDRTDDDAIALAHERGGVGVFVASPERTDPPRGADLVLPSPAAWVELLGAISARLGAGAT